MNGDTPAQTLQAQMDKPPANSKKILITFSGMGSVLFVFLVIVLLFLIVPSAAGELVVLGQVTIGALAGLAAAACGAVAAVDFKNSSSLASVVESKNQSK